MTGTTVIDDRVRVILDDTVAGASERWSDAVLIAWCNDGTRLIAELKPDSLLTAPYTAAAYADITVLGDTIILPDRYREGLVDYICARALAQDAQDERDLKRAQSHFDQFIIKTGLVATTPQLRARRP